MGWQVTGWDRKFRQAGGKHPDTPRAHSRGDPRVRCVSPLDREPLGAGVHFSAQWLARKLARGGYWLDAS